MQNLRPSQWIWTVESNCKPLSFTRTCIVYSECQRSIEISSNVFFVSAPTTWNSLSDSCKDVELLSTFRHWLKTELFNIVY